MADEDFEDNIPDDEEEMDDEEVDDLDVPAALTDQAAGNRPAHDSKGQHPIGERHDEFLPKIVALVSGVPEGRQNRPSENFTFLPKIH